MINSNQHSEKIRAEKFGADVRSKSAGQEVAPEPIAIIGLGCRFPGGADDWRAYWNLLESGTDAISETPTGRWSLQKFYEPNKTLPGKTQSKWGGYIDQIDQFDPQLFGISPREAAGMDPQQRILLEVAYRALEDAGQRTDQIAGEKVSVFVGISSFDYAVAGLSFQDRGVIDAYSNTGGSSSIAANRISYCFDLRGPSVAVDTACSSSLVALHMACESIWHGDAKLALAGGVNALLMPDFYVAFSQLGVLSPDGRCKTFDVRANGYVRSEGAGMVLLKPLSAALRDKDPIYSVVRSTALNQDGRTPGMTVPSQAAQEALIRTACKKACVDPSQISYVEAHGTGTPVGDPIEAAAIGAIVGNGRELEQACRIGSVKTNIGHLEAGAGIASIIKVALALHHRCIPAHLHFEQANPSIDFDALRLKVPRATEAWDSSGARIAGINGFGYGGANAHVILEEAPLVATAAMPVFVSRAVTADKAASQEKPKPSVSCEQADTDGLAAPVLLPISARSKSNLASVASAMADWLEVDTSYHLAEVAGYLSHRRSHHDCRATACSTNRADMIGELRSLAASNPDEIGGGIGASNLTAGPAFVCSGQGPQWWAMGRGLLRYSPAFRSVIKKCDAEFSKYGDWSLMEELTRGESSSRMQKTAIAQPSIFALQVALAAVWKSWGIQPNAVVGHSVGEIAAAYLAGALGWEDACCVAFHRGRTMDLASSQGSMVAAGLSPTEVPNWLQGMEHQVALAATNGPTSVTISGEAEAIETLAQRLEKAGVFCRRLAVEYAFHSPQMDPVCEELLHSLAHIRPRKTRIPLISTVTGCLIDGTEVDAEYWWRNVRQGVRFSDAMQSLADRKCPVVIEIGPHPVLAYSINECFQAAGYSVRSVPSLNRQQDDLQCITKSLGQLYSLGYDINWAGFYNQPTRKVALPNYPFQLQTCWSESYESRSSRLANQLHPLLGQEADGPHQAWQQRIDLKLQSYMADHCVRGSCIYPAAAMIESAVSVARIVQDSSVARIERLQFHSPCTLSNERSQWMETAYDSERRQVTLAVRESDSDEWTKLATFGISASDPVSTEPNRELHAEGLQAIRDRCTEGFDRERLYQYCDLLGLQYGQQFQGVVSGLRCEGESLVEVCFDATTENYHLHPALLDSCFHSMIAADPDFDHSVDGLYLPVSIEEFAFHRRPTSRLTVHARVLSKTKKFLRCDLRIYDVHGQLCCEIREFRSMRISGGESVERTEDLIYSYSWVEQQLPSKQTVECGTPRQWLVFMDESGVGREVTQRLRTLGDRVTEVYRENSQVAQVAGGNFHQVDPEHPASFSQLLENLSLDASESVDRILYLWGVDAPASEHLTLQALDASTQWTTLAPMHLIQAWDRQAEAATAELTMVTRGAQSQDGVPEATSVSQAPLIGFGRVVASEYAGLQSKLVDLPSVSTRADVDNLLAELLAEDEEDEILWRSGRRYVHRFSKQSGKPASVEAARSLPCQLHIGENAGIEELHYRTKPQWPLKPGQVEIEVFASGLNFSDVMKALDLYPGLPDGPVELGAECSGRISRVGENSRWSVGDEVIAVAPGSFGTHVTVNEALVALKPTGLTHQQAAAIPIAFLTAQYALHDCARLRSGDSVLIHSASGGVGLAAMQLANLSGIQVFATAGTDEKRQYVQRHGAEYVMDSRSLAFADEVWQVTGGHGIDAILNSLPGEAIAKGLSILKTGGRFLEIGKRDIYSDRALGLYPFRNNLALFAIDLDQLFKEQPQKMGQMLGQLSARFERGELEPLPVTSFSSNSVVSAYRFMQQGKHIGKVVAGYDQRPDSVLAGDFAPLCFDADATYWIAGGLGGFGLEIASWMAERGACSLVLSGRSRNPRPEAQAVIDRLVQNGVRVHIMPADITQEADVKRVLADIDRELPPLKGVLHTAMVLEDKLLVDLDRETLERVLRPKVLGGWNLHVQTQDRDLDFFVMFSSLSSVFGHAGQANYSAANAMLDSLAYYRRAQGLPATVMNWGHLGEVGYLAEREQLGKRLERQGVLSFSVRQATDCLEYALQTKAIQLSVLRMDWTLWRGLGVTHRVSPRFAHLLRSNEIQLMSAAGTTGAALRSAPEVKRKPMVEHHLRAKTSSLLGIPAEQIQSDRALLEMGLDSLMAVEMRNWIESQMEISLPISALMRSESLGHLTEHVCDCIAAGVGISGENSAEDPASDGEPMTTAEAEELLDELPNLPANEVSQLLGQLLREQGPG